MNVDILDIHDRIQKMYDQEYKKLPEYQKKINILKNITHNNLSSKTVESVRENIQMLTHKIEECNSKSQLEFYLSETFSILENYRNHLRKPLKMSFMFSKPISTEEIDKIKLEYLTIAKKYYDVHIPVLSPVSTLKCDMCSNIKSFDNVDDIYYVCRECGSQQEKNMNSVSYTDINRISIVTKYSYDRKVHFKECISQYQGIQNCSIDQKIYTEIENELQKHNLLFGDENTPRTVRFSKVTRKHVQTFLRELGYSRHYENVILIHSKLTGKKPDNISHLVDRLLSDFDVLLETYDLLFKNKIERKSFINSQCVLYQLLVKHKHPCNKEDFNILKTIERQNFHNDITRHLFSHLGWHFVEL